MVGDLWLADLDGATRRLTRGARLDHPSVTPDGREAVAIRVDPGTTTLVAVELATGEVRELVPSDPDVHWAFPAVSPDGRWIAAARWTPGAYFDVVVLDRLDGSVVEVTRDRALDTAPAWSPDGRWLVWSSDRSGIPNVLAVPFDRDAGLAGPVAQVTSLLTGGHVPSISPDGRWLYLSVYHADGWDVERLPFEPGGFFDPIPLAPRFQAARPPEEVAEVPPPEGLREKGYDPLRTLRPRYWEVGWAPPVTTRGYEVMGASWGVRTGGEDLVGRHAVGAELLLSTTDARPSGGLSYTYRGLGDPVLSVGVSQWWDASGPFAVEVEGEERVIFAEERERNASLAATFRRVRFRDVLSLRLVGGMTWEERWVLEEDLTRSDLRFTRPDPRLADLRATVGFTNARGHVLSTGFEKGVDAALTGRLRREVDVPDADRGEAGADRSVHEVIARLHAYEDVQGPGFADHVVAVRVAAALARGPGADPSHYDVGGTTGEREPLTGFSLFGGQPRFFPVRGFDHGERSGRNAWSASVEYRVPLAMVNEGIGLIPLHLDRIPLPGRRRRVGPDGVGGLQGEPAERSTGVGGGRADHRPAHLLLDPPDGPDRRGGAPLGGWRAPGLPAPRPAVLRGAGARALRRVLPTADGRPGAPPARRGCRR